MSPLEYNNKKSGNTETLLKSFIAGFFYDLIPAISRASCFKSARRSFPKDALSFWEFVFTKCREQGVHRRYAALFLSDAREPFLDRLYAAFSKSQSGPIRKNGKAE
jgi:hypothetical protein